MCFIDGIQAATGATYGKALMEKTFYGKLAAIFYHPKKGAVRYCLKPEFIDAMGKFEFFAFRKKELSRRRFRRKWQMRLSTGFVSRRMILCLRWKPSRILSFLRLKVRLTKLNAVSAGSMCLSDM